MPFEKGQSGNLQGRPPGPNKVTTEVREKFKEFVHGNLTLMDDWLARVAVTDPDKALDFMLKFSEYFIPKLQRTEITGEDGGDINIKWVIPNAKLDETKKG